jgi:hypothetical protein
MHGKRPAEELGSLPELAQGEWQSPWPDSAPKWWGLRASVSRQSAIDAAYSPAM